MEKMFLTFKDVNIFMVSKVIRFYLYNNVVVYNGLGEIISEDMLNYQLNLSHGFYINIPTCNIESYGCYYTNDGIKELDEIEDFIKSANYKNMSEAMFFGYNEKEWLTDYDKIVTESEWLRLQNKVGISLFWTTEEDED